MMTLTLGQLSLPCEDAVASATTQLKSLKLHELLQELREKDEKRQPLDLTKRTTGQLTAVDESIRVSITGLRQTPHINESQRLVTTVVDNDGVLDDFAKGIKSSFIKAGWMKETHIVQAKTFSGVKLVETNRLRIPVQKDGPFLKHVPKGKVIYKTLKSNAEEVFAKYHEHVWASDIALERLSIFKLGLHDIKRGAVLVGRGNYEVASIPLPGAPDVNLNAERKGLTYEKSGKSGFFIPGATYDVTKR